MVAEGLVVAVEFAIGGDGDELRLSALAFRVIDLTGKRGRGKAVGVVGGLGVERHGAAQMAVVEEGGDLASARQPHEIRLRRVDRLGGLPWRQDGVAHASLGGQIERLQIDSGLSEPHALRWMAEAVGEIGQPPVNLRAFIARRGKGQDGVVVRLRQRIADAVALAVAPVGIHDALVYVGMMRFEPVRQRGAEIEADALKDASRRVGTIAFGGDLLVEVVVVAGAWLVGHLSSKWIFARRLIEVSVDTEILACHCHSLCQTFRKRPLRWDAPRSGDVSRACRR